jgi:predicted nucleic acid-binding protein
MSRRKRINASVSPEEYEELRQVMKMAKLRNMAQLSLGAMRLLLMYIKRIKARQLAQGKDADDIEVIARMFRDFGDHERQPDGTVPVRHPRRTIK